MMITSNKCKFPRFQKFPIFANGEKTLFTIIISIFVTLKGRQYEKRLIQVKKNRSFSHKHLVNRKTVTLSKQTPSIHQYRRSKTTFLRNLESRSQKLIQKLALILSFSATSILGLHWFANLNMVVVVNINMVVVVYHVSIVADGYGEEMLTYIYSLRSMHCSKCFETMKSHLILKKTF